MNKNAEYFPHFDAEVLLFSNYLKNRNLNTISSQDWDRKKKSLSLFASPSFLVDLISRKSFNSDLSTWLPILKQPISNL